MPQNAGNEGRIYMNGSLLAYRSGDGTTVYSTQDALGTERMRTNYAGAILDTFKSLPFGDGYTFGTGTAGSATYQDSLHFSELDHDTETSTEHATYRQYSSNDGRWMMPDPYDGSYDATNPQSYNRYTYALNNPVKLLDPLGLQCGSKAALVSGLHPNDDDGGCESNGNGGGGGGGCPVQACVTTTPPPSPDPDPDPDPDPFPGPYPAPIYGGVVGGTGTSAPSNPLGPPLPCQVQTQTALNNKLGVGSIYQAPTFQLQGLAPGLRGGNYNYNYFLPGVTGTQLQVITGRTGRFSGGLHIPQPGGPDPITALYGGGQFDGLNGSFVTAHLDSVNPLDDLFSLFAHFINDVLLGRGRGGCKG